MSEQDFTFLTGSLSAGNVDRGVTAAFTPPNGGGSFIFGFASKAVVTGAVGLFGNQTNYAPTSSGGSVRCAMKRAPSGGTTGFAPMLFIGLGGPDVSDTGYLLGLQDDDPSHIVLKKGQPVGNLQAGTPDPVNNGILRRSTNSVAEDTWVHLRLDMIVNGSGDVVLKVFENDLNTNTVASPVWVAVAGMADFIDDALGVSTGSSPLTSGRIGFAFYTEDVSRRAFFDQLRLLRQL